MPKIDLSSISIPCISHQGLIGHTGKRNWMKASRIPKFSLPTAPCPHCGEASTLSVAEVVAADGGKTARTYLQCPSRKMAGPKDGACPPTVYEGEMKHSACADLVKEMARPTQRRTKNGRYLVETVEDSNRVRQRVKDAAKRLGIPGYTATVDIRCSQSLLSSKARLSVEMAKRLSDWAEAKEREAEGLHYA